MKSISVVALLALAAFAGAEWIDIDWSKVKPIDEFDHYWTRLPAELQVFRNTTPSQRIVGGVVALPGQFPYQIALLSNFATGTGLCGGTVLTNNFILTAAHCLVDGNNVFAASGTAILGAHDRTIVEASQQRIGFTRAGMFVHAGYLASTIRNDIATVRLNTPAQFNARVQPIRLPARSDTRTFAGMEGTASGFGRTSDANPNTAAVISFTRNPILSNAQCNTFWSTTWVQNQNICLSAAGGRTTCHGDSGGPLTVQDGGRSLEVGISSFVSVTGCVSGFPSVFVRVSFFRDWIQQNSDFVFGA